MDQNKAANEGNGMQTGLTAHAKAWGWEPGAQAWADEVRERKKTVLRGQCTDPMYVWPDLFSLGKTDWELSMVTHAYCPITWGTEAGRWAYEFQNSLGNTVFETLSQDKTEKGQKMGKLGGLAGDSHPGNR